MNISIPLLSVVGLLVVGLSRAAVAPASSDEAPPDGSKMVTLTLVSELDGLKPGSTANLGLHFAITPKWHIYWPGANDSGFPPSIEISCPDGYSVGKPQWPAPVRHLSEGDVLDHVYEQDTLVIVPVTIPSDAAPGTSISLRAESHWLVCKDACVPGEGTSSLSLPVAAEPKPSAKATLFAAGKARQPGPLPTDASVSCKIKDGQFVATAPGAAALRFFPLAESADLLDLITRADVKGATLTLSLKAPKPGDRVLGVLEVVPSPSTPGAGPAPSRFYSVDLPAAAPDPRAAQPTHPDPADRR